MTTRGINLKTYALVFLFLGMVAGCRSNPTPPDRAIPVPQEFVLLKQQELGTLASRTIFIRDTDGPPGSRWLIHIDGEPAVRLGKGESYSVNLAPGDHIFGIEPDAKWKVLQVVNLDQVLTSGKTYYYRAMFSPDLGYRLQRSTPGAPDAR